MSILKKNIPTKLVAPIFVGLLLLLAPICVRAQMRAPLRQWAGLTSYALSSKQDSVFAFYADSDVKLVAADSSNNAAQFIWLRFSDGRFADTIRRTTNAVAADTLMLSSDVSSEAGYRVLVDNSLGEVQVYTVWMFIDDVRIDTLLYDNECDYLRVEPRTIPNRYDVEWDRFVYWDLSRPTPIPINTYGRSYFSQVRWECDVADVELPERPRIDLQVVGPAPYYDAQYTLNFTSPFGRTMSAQSTTIEAVAVKADSEVKMMKSSVWEDFSESEKYEALLEMSLKSTSLNADSVCWSISRQQPNNGRYARIWGECAAFSSAEIFPDKAMMVPGRYRLVHTAKNTTSRCIDSTYIEFMVDSSMIKEEAFPNVFTPTNADGINDVFRFVDPEQNIRSMQSCLIRIYNRSGKLMHTYDGDPRQWQGWDGKTHGRMANPGIYYYIVECTGWDGQIFKKREPYKGFFYLY